MKVSKPLILLLHLLCRASSDLIGINRYQNTIQHHNTGLKEIIIGNSKAVLERALLKQYYSFLAETTSIGTKVTERQESIKTDNSAETLAKLKNVVKRAFRRRRYFKNMQS